MSLLFFTGFNGMDGALVGRRFAFARDCTVGAGGRFGKAVTITNGGEATIPITGTPREVRFGISVKTVDAYLAQDPTQICLMYVSTVAGDICCQVNHLKIEGAIQVRGPSPAFALLYQSADGSYPLGVWNFVELGVTVGTVDGAIELRVNGATLYSATGLDTRNGSASSVAGLLAIGSYAAGPILIDCVYIADLAGSAPHNDFLGDCRADPVFPTGTVSTMWAPSASTNLSCVDDGHTPDDNATITTSVTADDADEFSVSGYTAPSAAILGYRVAAMGSATVGDGRTIAATLDDGAPHVGTDTEMFRTWREADVIVEEATGAYGSAGAASAAINAFTMGYVVTL